MKSKITIFLFSISFMIGLYFGRFTLENTSSNVELKTSGAFQSLQFWTAQRAFPDKDIPADKYFTAFQKKKYQSVKIQTEEKWKAIGPKNIGGRTLSIAIDPLHPDTIFAGSAGGGLWRSVTAGKGENAWEYVSTGYPIHGVGAIAINPKNPLEMFIGTGEVYNYGNSFGGVAIRETRGSYGIGILKTTDGGKHWVKSLDWSYNQQTAILSLEIDPVNSSIIWAGTTEGTFKSTNAGDDWVEVNSTLMVTDILINPVDPEIVYIACGNLSSEGNGIYVTDDGGENWTKLTNGLPSSYGGKALLDIYKSDPNIIYASIGDGYRSGDPSWLCKTTDGGTSWDVINQTNYTTYQGWFSHFVVINQENPDEVLAAGVDVWKSYDGGKNIERKSDWAAWYFGQTYTGESEGPDNYSHADHHAFAVHPDNPNIVFLANDGGIFLTEDFGETFEGRNGGYQTTQFYGGFSVAHEDSNLAMGGLQDNGTAIYLGEHSWYRVIGGDGSWTAINEQGNFLYGSWQYLNIRRSNEQLVFSDYVSPQAQNPGFIAPYVNSITNPSIMYAASQKIHRSTNSGDTWIATASNSRISNNIAVSLAVSPHNYDFVLVGYAPVTGNAEILRTFDGGDNWENVTANLPNRYPMDISFDYQNEMNVYVVFSGFGTSHAFKSTDAGNSWIDISEGLPDVPTSTISVNPYNSDIIYVGNDLGIYVSFNGGETWGEFNAGLPDGVFAMDLSFSTANDVMRLATHGNGVFESKLLNQPVTAISEDKVAVNFELLQNYPNPFNPVTNIIYKIPQRDNVTLKVFNPLGETVTVLVNNVQAAGTYSVEFNGGELSSGVYIYQLKYGNQQITKKMNLIK